MNQAVKAWSYYKGDPQHTCSYRANLCHTRTHSLPAQVFLGVAGIVTPTTHIAAEIKGDNSSYTERKNFFPAFSAMGKWSQIFYIPKRWLG